MKKLFTLSFLIGLFGSFSEAKTSKIHSGVGNSAIFSPLINTAIPPDNLNLRVTCAGDRYTITWTTPFETNNRRFLLYKSNNGMKFDLAATINSMAPAGNSDIAISYSYTDNSIVASSAYYRLASEDRSGHITDYGIVTPSCGSMGAAISLLPNPATTQSVLTMQGVRELMDIKVHNSIGQIIYENKSGGTVYLPAGKWASDVYVITVTNRRNEVVYQNRLVKQ